MIQDGDNYTETVLRERDLISVPRGIYRGLFNHGEEEALMCVMLGTQSRIFRPTRKIIRCQSET
jgi:cupin superfamily acireductone dioxygenase involved in methionine salvage